jgi:hypothetical protein
MSPHEKQELREKFRERKEQSRFEEKRRFRDKSQGGRDKE